ncbi:MAG: glycosyl hydrolase family 8 [Gammaproteobacteria bacterium]
MHAKLLLTGVVALAAFLTACQWQSEAELEKEWQLYRSQFIADDGRVVDTGNNGVSHSEGQGYGMILAVRFGDRDTFERIWQWTRNNLQVRNDRLFIWRRRPQAAIADEDQNNASDGDIIIAWALLEAAGKWQQSAYQQEAFAIMNDIKRKLVLQRNGNTVILPGEFGFQTQGRTVLNLSYWVYPAFRTFSVQDPDPVWQELIGTGLLLLRQARFGRWQLPPDWLELGNDGAMAPTKSGRFGYDAARVPLYLVAGGITEQDVLAPFVEYWSFYQGYTPSWIDLNENVMDSYGAAAGIIAIKQITLAALHKTRTDLIASVEATQDYYSATLLLLCKLSARQARL